MLEIDDQVSTWVVWVAEKRKEYEWLLFLRIPKVLILNTYLCSEQALENLDKVVHELSFLCVNTTAARNEVCKGITVHN